MLNISSCQKFKTIETRIFSQVIAIKNYQKVIILCSWLVKEYLRQGEINR